MTDFVFSQLEDISNDTFQEFSPYSYDGESEWNSTGTTQYYGSSPNTYCDSYSYGYESPQYNEYNTNDQMYDDYSSYDNYQQSQQQMQQQQQYSQVPSEIRLKDIDLHDYNGRRIDHLRIVDIKLKLFHHFFGLEYNDSVFGKAVSQFFPTDIITVVRQCDRVGIFFQFRRFLTCRKFSDDLFSGVDAGNAEHMYYKDSPFVHCMYVMLEFVDGNHINNVFNYLSTNERINSNLKMVYNQWMFCAQTCTDNDVHLISLSISRDANGMKHVDSAFNPNTAAVVERPEETDDTSDDEGVEAITKGLENMLKVQPKQPIATTARTSPKSPRRLGEYSPTNPEERRVAWAQNNAQKAKTENQKTALPPRKKSLPSAIIAIDKIEAVLPPTFATIAQDVREFTLLLLKEGRLLPFQISVGLCQTLSIAETAQSKNRAKSILLKMSQQPNPVQLSNLSLVARYILGQKEPLPPVPQFKKSPATKPVQQIKDEKALPTPPPKRNSHPDVIKPPKNVEYGVPSPSSTTTKQLKGNETGCVIS